MAHQIEPLNPARRTDLPGQMTRFDVGINPLIVVFVHNAFQISTMALDTLVLPLCDFEIINLNDHAKFYLLKIGNLWKLDLGILGIDGPPSRFYR